MAFTQLKPPSRQAGYTEWSIYHGVEQGITAYQDGSLLGTDTSRWTATRISGNGEVVIGKRDGAKYASAFVDEIKMYNRQLSQEEIANMYWIIKQSNPGLNMISLTKKIVDDLNFKRNWFLYKYCEN